MTLLVLAWFAGVLTILSPCILPVLPFVFAGAGRSFARAGLPLLLGMAGAFTAVATLAAVGGGWVLAASQYGRLAALALLALFAATLLSERFAQWLYRPLVALGQRIAPAAAGDGPAAPLAAVLLGVATGLLWAPCAGPILGLILTGAALNGASVATTLLIFAYALGAATSLAVALLAGAKLTATLKRSAGAGASLRRGLGVAVLAGVGAVAFGWDAQLLSRIDLPTTAALEQRLLEWTGARKAAASNRTPSSEAASPAARPTGRRAAEDGAPMLIDIAFADAGARGGAPGDAERIAAAGLDRSVAAELPVEGALPGFAGATEWLNSPPLTAQALRGKAALVVFWTYNCVNCLNALPHVRAWAEKYRGQGLVVVGVHTPELPFERDVGNVRKAVGRLKITYPVAIDNSYAIWKAFGNEYWPALYFVDAEGRIRHHHFGEHDYENSERVIQQLLREAGGRDVRG